MGGVLLQKEIFEKYLAHQMKRMMSLDRSAKDESGIAALIVTLIELGRQAGEIRGDLPAALAVDFFLFVFIEAAKPYYQNPEGYNQARAVDRSAELFVNGLRPVL
jgi:hypothetical protein